MTNHTINPWPLFGLSCLLTLMLVAGSGCMTKANQSNGLFLPEARQLPALRSVQAPRALPSDQPSLTQGAQRSQFQRVVVEIPQAAVGFHPNYTTSALRNRQNGRAFPTANEALDDGNGPGMVMLDVPLDLGYLIFDAVALPVRLVMTPPWSVQRAPTDSFELLPTTRTNAP